MSGPRVAALLFALLFALPARAGSGSDLETARRLLAAGEVERAYELVRPLAEEEHDANAEALLLEACLRSYRYAEGARVAERIASAVPVDAELLASSALLLAQHGEVTRALALLDAGAAKAGDSSALIRARARLRYSIGNVDGAAADSRRLLADDASDAGAHYLLGACLARQGDAKGAKRELLAALATSPRHARALFELGRLELGEGEYERAVIHLRACLRAEPRDPGALQALGQALLRLGKREEAQRTLAAFQRANDRAEREKDLEQAVRVNPGNLEALADLAAFLIETERAREALAPLERALHAAPKSARLLALEGRALAELGKRRPALAAMQAALAADGDLHDIRLRAAELRARLGDVSGALTDLDACRGKVDEARWNLARGEVAARGGGGWEKTAPFIRAAVEASAHGSMESVLAWTDLARAFHHREDAAAALTAWQKKNPGDARFAVARGVMALDDADLAAARARLEEAQAIDPWFPPTYGFLARVALLQKKSAEAQRLAKRAQELQIIAP